MAIITGTLSFGRLAGKDGMKEGRSVGADGGRHEDSSERSTNSPSDKREAHYVAGPGFELAIRATFAHPLEVEVKGTGADSKDNRRNADRDHRHEVLERRLEALERAILMV